MLFRSAYHIDPSLPVGDGATAGLDSASAVGGDAKPGHDGAGCAASPRGSCLLAGRERNLLTAAPAVR